MSTRIKGMFRSHLRERPFDFYTAFVLFLLGVYGIVDDGWPESLIIEDYSWIITLISVYLMIPSGMIMLSLTCNKKKRPIFALVSEMYGWMFISAAATATALSYIGAIVVSYPENILSWSIWFVIWVGMAIASLVRACDLYSFYRSLTK
jgi:hypothetical protein